jgi:M6 family metalloprotease-like protein
MPYPFYEKKFVFTQPDGTRIDLKGWGNQNYAVFETPDGYSVVKDPATGFYQYAKRSPDGKRLVPTGVVVGTAKPETLGLERHLRVPRTVAKEMALAPFQKKKFKTRWEERREKARAAQHKALKTPGIAPAPPKEERVGEYCGLCILIQFPDEPGTISRSEVEDFCNKKGYTGFGNNGSVYDYFFDESGGRLKYTNIVVGYYTAKNPEEYYANPGIPHGTRARELVEEALSDLREKGFDFSALSTDKEGFVYAVNVFYAGTCPNNWGEGLWPHSWGLEAPFEVDAQRRCMDYQISDMGKALTLATFCHENGHMICDFPDLYDYGDQSNGVGMYCSMCWGGPDDTNPTQFSAYLKYKAGWADRVVPLKAGTYTVKSGKNEFYIRNKNATEYFILENRHNRGRDASLPSSGLAIWHVDELGSNEDEDMTADKHYECSLEQADSNFDLERRSNLGDGGDLFYSPNRTNFDNSAEPNSKWWDGNSSDLEIVNVGHPGEEVEFRVK